MKTYKWSIKCKFTTKFCNQENICISIDKKIPFIRINFITADFLIFVFVKGEKRINYILSQKVFNFPTDYHITFWADTIYYSTPKMGHN